ncbi:MAG TPA: YbaK/EbsC family protein [Gemmataceae bacterium]|nr:YbaK/EbsC family protein [Gemmataceae bacterium]
MKLDDLLIGRHITFQRLPHRRTYTANRMAQALHVKGRQVAKTVLVRIGQGHALAVLPATHHIDLDQLGDDLGEARVELASEEEMDRLFPDCERGVLPPFGSLYRLPTIMDESLAEDPNIVFEARDHEQAIRMSVQDYEAVEHPRRGHFAHR